MRIFQSIEFNANLSVPGNRTWYGNLYESLIEMGHEVVLVPAEEGRKAMQSGDTQARDIFSQKLLDTFTKEHRREPFDLFFTYFMDGMVDPAIIDEIRSNDVPTCNFSCNNTHQFDLVDELSPHYDYNLHSEKDAAQKFRTIGATPVWFPMAANPKYYHPYDLPRTVDVSFVGQCYARRPHYIWHLLENGVDVQVYGPGWVLKKDRPLLRRIVRWGRRTRSLFQTWVAQSPAGRYRYSARLAENDFREWLRWKYPSHLHEPIEDGELIRKYSESKISIGFLEVYDGHDPAASVKQHLHLREFEAPMSGACYFTGRCEELAEFYEPDKEVVVYSNEHELLDKVRYYLSHPEEAEKVRLAGHRRALADHTYKRRYETLFQQLHLTY